MSVWVLATQADQLQPLVAAAQATGQAVEALTVGSAELAAAASGMGVAKVHWIETAPDVPAEAYAGAVAKLAEGAEAALWLAGGAPDARVLLAAAAVASGAGLASGGVAARLDGGTATLERNALDGAVVETLTATAPLAVIWDSNDGEPNLSETPAPVERVPAEPLDWEFKRESLEPAAAAAGLLTAERVIGVGRGVKARADLAQVEELAAALGAEMACSMPIADDFHWYPEDRYIGRSGQKIAPRLYLALGISGEPQHMEGVRGAKTVVAVNNDPDAVIFRRAAYGIVADLYEVVPALARALQQD
ncbi:MAG: electron transfer flavoprotein subunit alpha/FixB family protein [Bifidobacteriaceae bacterium]|jgi:electron transfer flavoprotein alpha subunit|nr:electron transfer flavoprotein subunit alpha/FixB family protein [Bifidobacteriaceae bacterium]